MGKDIIKSIRFSDDEISEIEKKAKQDRRKVSDWMRCRLLEDKSIQGWNKK